MIKIRLHGLPEEIEEAKKIIEKAFNVNCASSSYSDRGSSKYKRIYLDCEIRDAEKIQTPQA